LLRRRAALGSRERFGFGDGVRVEGLRLGFERFFLLMSEPLR
jgi:hypothetical protein